MDEPKGKPSWLEWAVIIALVIVTVVACLILLGPQINNTFTNHGGVL